MRVPLGFGTPDWYGMLDWVIRTACRLAGGPLGHVPVARSSEHVRRSAVFSELRLGNGNQFKIHAPPGKAGRVTQGIGVRSHEGYDF